MKTFYFFKASRNNFIISAVLFFVLFFLSSNLISQTVIKVGNSQSFTSVSEAFNSLPGTLTNAYMIEIESDYNSAGESQIRVLSRNGSSNLNYILVAPAANVSATISISDNNFLFYFSGATYVTIDGKYNGPGSSLTLKNTNTSGSTIQFTESAQFNTIKNCNIIGRNTSVTSGVIVFGTATAGTGNSYNTITQNKISGDGTFLPANIIYSDGSAGHPNANNIFTKNELFNYTSYGIYITSSGNGNNWTIGGNNSDDGNSIYQTSTVTTSQIAIYFKPGSSSYGNLIANNYIGGQSSQCTGSPWTINGNISLVGIKANVSTSQNGVDIKYNNIQNISITGSTSSAYFYGIYADSGAMTVSQNIIGHNSTPNSILSDAPALLCGFYGEAIYATTVSYNNIANLTNTNTGNSTTKIRGIVHNNIVGNSNGKITILGNNIHDLKNAGIIPFPDGTIYGIVYTDSSSLSQAEISNNVIYNLNCTNSSGVNVYMGAIEIDNCAYNLNIFNNRIYNLVNSNLVDPMIGGVIVHLDYGTHLSHLINIFNNMISLNNNSDVLLFGIWDMNVVSSQVNMNVYYNSILLSGTITSGSNKSSCYSRGFTGATPPTLPVKSVTKLRNNIFINIRTGGTGSHYSVINAPDVSIPPATNWASNYSNYNFLTTSNVNAVGGWGNGSSFTDYNFADWVNQTGVSMQDNNSWYLPSSSVQIYNLFNSPSTADLSIRADQEEAWYVNGKGIAGPESGMIVTDIANTSRSTIYGNGTDIGAFEFDPSSIPPTPDFSGIIAIGNTQTITFGGRTLATITWNSGTSLPTSYSFSYFTGQTPPGVFTGNYGDSYWTLTQTGGANFNYNLSLYYDPALIGTISAENAIRLAKREGSGSWNHYTFSTVNTVNKTISFSGFNTMLNTSFGLSDANFPMPVTLSSFNFSVNDRNVKLYWMTSSEHNNSGFDIERQNNDKGTNNTGWQKIGFVKGNGNTASNYNFEDSKLNAGKYQYRLKQTDNNGNNEYYNLQGEVAIGLPVKTELMQNYPNPFNPSTVISYSLSVKGFVSIKIYDLSGREMASLVNTEQNAGYYEIKLNINNLRLSSGIYFYKLSTSNISKIMKMMVIK